MLYDSRWLHSPLFSYGRHHAAHVFEKHPIANRMLPEGIGHEPCTNRKRGRLLRCVRALPCLAKQMTRSWKACLLPPIRNFSANNFLFVLAKAGFRAIIKFHYGDFQFSFQLSHFSTPKIHKSSIIQGKFDPNKTKKKSDLGLLPLAASPFGRSSVF